MTLALGRRFIIVDGVERWKDKDLDALEAALARSRPRRRSPSSRARTVATRRQSGCARPSARPTARSTPRTSVKPWELPKWVLRACRRAWGRARTRRGAGPDPTRRGAPAAVAARAREAGPRRTGRRPARRRGDRRVDGAIGRAQGVGGRGRAGGGRRRAAVRAYLALRDQGERVPGLLYWISQRVRVAHDVAIALDAGEPPAQIKRRLRMPSRAADRLIADARRGGSERLRRATCEIADLELASRGRSGGRGGRGHRRAGGHQPHRGLEVDPGLEVDGHPHDLEDRGDHAEHDQDGEGAHEPVGARSQRRVARSLRMRRL